MPEDGREIQKKKTTIRPAGFSRREFLQWAGIVVGGTALTAMTTTSACKSSKTTTSKTTSPVETSNSTTSTLAPTQLPTSPPTSSVTTTTSGVPTSSPATSTSGIPVITGYSYIPPTVSPPLLAVAGTTCNVATDRLYSADHIWVKSLSATMVVMGITPTFVEILGEPYKISLPPVGTSMSAMDIFGSIEGYKISADLITPVSGGVFEFDKYVVAQSADGGQIGQINDDPYNSGWLLVVQLSKPNEINSLLSPQAYMKLIAK